MLDYRAAQGKQKGISPDLSTTSVGPEHSAAVQQLHLSNTLKALWDSERSRDHLQLALDSARLAAWFYDPVRKIVGGDARMAILFGLSVAEGPLELWLAPVVEQDRDRVAQAFAYSAAGALHDMEYRVTVDGKERWLHARAKPTAEEGTVVFIGVCEDITDRKHIAVVAERSRLAGVAGKLATWDWDTASGEVTWDPHSFPVYGRKWGELDHVDKALSIVHEDDLLKLNEAISRTLREGVPFECEFRVCWPDNSTHWLLGQGTAIKNAHGEVTRIVGINIETTDRRLAEEVLRKTEKLAAVGRMASTIAHEINNPLEAVTNLIYLAQQHAISPETRKYLDMTDRELRRMKAISNQTLRFHRQSTRPTACSCLDLISSALSIYEARIANMGIAVEKRKRADRPVVCFEGEVAQVISNLISNALDAMTAHGGRLLLRSREGTDWRTGRYGLVITVADTGTGMSSYTVRHLYEAFFSTKGIGGTGLGLWISAGIAARHQGRLLVRSSEAPAAHGTVFTLFLPYKTTA